jgi:hypothetical protein
LTTSTPHDGKLPGGSACPLLLFPFRPSFEVNVMATVEHGELQVVVPVGFLLAEAQEVTVSVNRPGGEPLPVRLKLVPARPVEEVGALVEEELPSASDPTPLPFGWPRRDPFDDIYEPEYGGSD